MQVFVQDFKVVDARFEDVEPRLATGGETLFGEALGSTRSAHERITAKVGPKGWPTALGKTVEIRFGPVRRHGDWTLIAFSWEARGGGSLFPHLDADLEAAPFGPDQTMLTVRGTYDPPAGRPGRVVDDLVLHRIAESTIRAFLDALCAEFSESISPR
ncbi:MAG: hypothetical protein ACRDV4_02610 [Acidimicrobiales bacterium]